jgi:hypothetical protein
MITKSEFENNNVLLKRIWGRSISIISKSHLNFTAQTPADSATHFFTPHTSAHISTHTHTLNYQLWHDFWAIYVTPN